MSHNPETPIPFNYKCEFCNNPDLGTFWVIPPVKTHIKASKNKDSRYQIANILEMTITCPNVTCGKVNTIYWTPV